MTLPQLERLGDVIRVRLTGKEAQSLDSAVTEQRLLADPRATRSSVIREALREYFQNHGISY